jgi:hypothetical protein
MRLYIQGKLPEFCAICDNFICNFLYHSSVDPASSPCPSDVFRLSGSTIFRKLTDDSSQLHCM